MHDRMLDFIGDIYEASLASARWPQVMEQLCSLTDTRSSVLVIEDQLSGRRQIVSMHGINRIMSIAYNSGLGRHDNTFELMDALSHDSVTLMSAEDLRKDHPNYYRFIMRPADIGHLSAVDIYRGDDIRIGLAIHRSFKSPAFNEQDAQLLKTLAPHFARALLIHQQLQTLQTQNDSVHQLISKIPVSILLLDASGKVLHVNDMADDLIKRQSVLKISGGQLTGSTADVQKNLAEALAGFPEATDSSYTATVPLYHSSEAFPLVLHLTQGGLLTPEQESVYEGKIITVYLSQPGAQLNLSAKQIERVFGFTATEAQVAVSITNGLTLNEIAELNGTKSETTRSHLKAIFRKLGVNRQQDVIRIIVQAAVPGNVSDNEKNI